MGLKKAIKKTIDKILLLHDLSPNCKLFEHGICLTLAMLQPEEPGKKHLMWCRVEQAMNNRIEAEKFTAVHGAYYRKPGKWKARIRLLRTMRQELEDGTWIPFAA